MTRTASIDGLNTLCAGEETPGTPVLLCLHGFGDHGGMFAPLLATSLARHYRLVAPDLPGCGQSAPESETRTIDEFAARLVRFLDALDGGARFGLVGHSIASAIAVELARKRQGNCLGLFSIEGNLTAKDAYFSGQASKWDDADDFKAHLVKGTRNMANFKPELTRYADALEMADAQTLWRLGKDAFRCSRDDGLGDRYRALECPTLYYWCAKTTPALTRKHMEECGITALEYFDAGHWPTIDAPDACAQAIEAFFERNTG